MIKKFVIEISGVTYEMNYAEAEKLYEELSKIFGKKIEYVPSYPSTPTIPWYPPPVVTYQTNTGTPPPNYVSTQCGSDYKVH
jgi:hypothetical protein